MPTFNINIDSQIELLTKSAIGALVGSSTLVLKKIYIVTDATATNDKRIILIANSTNTLSQAATNLTDNQFGTYDLGTDIFTPIPTGGTQDLQDVTDIGNTTTNHIELINNAEVQFGSGGGLLFDNGARVKEGSIDANLGGVKGVAQICSVGYELKWEAGRLYVMNQGGTQIRQSLYNFNVAPVATDDNTLGYYIGSLWTMDDGTTYVCTDATTGAAVWSIVNFVQSVTGSGVDNTDPLNPVINLATVATSGDYNDLSNLPSIPAAQVNSDWNAVSGVAEILNKPTIPAAQIQSDWNQANNTLADFIKNKPTIPAAQVNSDWNSNSGVSQILNKPTIPAAQIQSDWTQTNNAALDFIKNKPTLATVATSGSYADLTNKPPYLYQASAAHATIAGSTNRFLQMIGGIGINLTVSSQAVIFFRRALTFSNFRVRTIDAQPAGGSLVFTVMSGSDPTALNASSVVITIAAGSAAGVFTSANTLTINNGDYVCYRLVNNSANTSGRIADITIEGV